MPVSCIAAICGAISWHIYRSKVDELNLRENARIRRITAERGDASAQADLAFMYSHGQGVPQDYAEAVRWYLRAADQGDAKAEGGLAFMYSHGQGVPQDYAEAVRWYRRAADQGDAKAKAGLAFMYSHGQGVPQDYAEAVRWYREAAEGVYARAKYDLGNMYYNGRGVPQDGAEAIRWYRKAADEGDEYALRALSAPLTIVSGAPLLVQFLWGIWTLKGSFKSQVSRKCPRGFRSKVFTGTAVLGIFAAGLSLYGYAHYMIRCLSCGFAAFTLLRWLLNAVWVALMVYIVRSGKKFGLPQDGIDTSDVATTA